MGCVASSPVVEDEPDLIVVRPTDGDKSSTTRARRLSVSSDPKRPQQPGQPHSRSATPGSPARGPTPTPPGQLAGTRSGRASPAGGGNRDAPLVPPQPDSKGAGLPRTSGEVLERNSATRSRRLSYVTNDKDLADKIRAEYGEQYCETEGGGGAGGGGAGGDGAAQRARRAVNVAVACMSRAGREPGYKKTNQDSCFAFEKYISEDESLFGAMDGHGPQGHLVSSFVKQHLPILLVDHLTNGSAPQRALAEGFLEVDARLGASKIDCEFSGSTCVVAYLKGNALTTAWVGDSRGVLGRHSGVGGWQAVDLTADHKPTNPKERERILRSQGRVERLMDELGQPMGPHRVWLQYAWVPGLAMSRALGDQLAHQVGVSSEPDHHHVALSPHDKFMVLASDGVWEFITSQEAVDLVAGCGSVEDACRALVDEAYQRWLVEEDGVVDDITAVVVRFDHAAEPVAQKSALYFQSVGALGGARGGH